MASLNNRPGSQKTHSGLRTIAAFLKILPDQAEIVAAEISREMRGIIKSSNMASTTNAIKSRRFGDRW